MSNCRRCGRAGSHCGSDGDLTFTRRRSRQEQVRHVHAGDQQNKEDRAEEHQQSRLRAPDYLFVERLDLDATTLVRVRELLRLSLGDLVE